MFCFFVVGFRICKANLSWSGVDVWCSSFIIAFVMLFAFVDFAIM